MRIEINSEDDAWLVLEHLISGKVQLDSLDDLVFGDWVAATLYVPDQRYDSALNAYMMQGWQDAQRALYRSFAITAKGAIDARSLTDYEKEKLELVVKVSSGSSDQQAELTGVIKEAIVTAVENMEPTHIAIVLIVAILTWAGQSVTRHWISKKSEEKLAEIEAGKQTEQNRLLAQAFQSIETVSSDTTRMALLRQAKEVTPEAGDVLGVVEREAEAARHSLVKHASRHDAKVNGVQVPSEVAQRITRETRTTPIEVRKDGQYRVLKVDTTVPDGFRVSVQNTDTEESFNASVQEVMSSLEDREIIKDAEWSKVPVRLQVNAKMNHGVVQEALILRAEKVEVPAAETESTKKENRKS